MQKKLKQLLAAEKKRLQKKGKLLLRKTKGVHFINVKRGPTRRTT